MGTLGAGNHYAEIQVVDEIYDKWAACKMGIEEKGQVCVMIHSGTNFLFRLKSWYQTAVLGSRGFGHQVATDALVQMEKAMKRDKIETNDRQLACARINSVEGQDYLKSMAAAANFAWVNRSSMTFLTRQVPLFSRTFGFFLTCVLAGFRQTVCHDTRWPGHARYLRCFPQYCQSRGTYCGWQAEDAFGA